MFRHRGAILKNSFRSSVSLVGLIKILQDVKFESKKSKRYGVKTMWYPSRFTFLAIYVLFAVFYKQIQSVSFDPNRSQTVNALGFLILYSWFHINIIYRKWIYPV